MTTGHMGKPWGRYGIWRVTLLATGVVALAACASHLPLSDADIESLQDHFELQSRKIQQARTAAYERGIHGLVVRNPQAPPRERFVSAVLHDARVAAVIDRLHIGYTLSGIPALTGRVTARFEDLPMPDALAAILNPVQLQAVFAPHGIVISRLPKVSLELDAVDDYVFAKRVLHYADTRELEPILPMLLGDNSDSDDDEDDGDEFGFSSDEDDPAAVSTPTKSLMYAPIHAENAILLKGPSAEVQNAMRLLDAIDTDSGHVMIEVVVLQFSAGELLEIGSHLSDGATGEFSDVSIDWASLIGETIAFTNVAGAANTRTFRAAISLLLENNFARVVARPYLAAVSGEQARIEVVEDRYVTAFTENTGEVMLEPVTSGVVMEMTPFVLPDEQIRMDVDVSVSQFVPSLNNVALARRRSDTSSTMRVGAGETLVIGGLMAAQSARSSSGLPGLRSIPGLGFLFGTRQTSDEQRRLLIYITPYIWTPGMDTPVNGRQDLTRFIERQQGFPSANPADEPVPETRGEDRRGSDVVDPFEFCADVGTTGVRPGPADGARFPPGLVGPMAAAGIVSEQLPESVWDATHWRCMDSAVWVCPVGANLPCTEQAETSTKPSRAMNEFCRTNPDAAAIPSYVTGRATVYAWTCGGRKPFAGRQIFTPDAQGYLSEFWYRLDDPDRRNKADEK